MHNPKAGQIGRIFAFVGAKGGVGSSTIAHNVGWLLSRKLMIDTVITDLDLAFGTAGLNFNQDAAQGIVDALGQPERVDQTLLDRLLAKAGEQLSPALRPRARSIATMQSTGRRSSTFSRWCGSAFPM